MDMVEFLGAAIVAIWVEIAVLKKAIPWLAGAGSRYIPAISLLLGVGVAVYCHFEYGADIVAVLVASVIPMLGSSGLNSVKNTYFGE